MKYKFYLKPGQQAPEVGSTGIAMPDGGIVWEGEKWTHDKLEAKEFTAEDEKEWELLQEFMKIGLPKPITFEEYKDPTLLTAKIAAEKTALDAVKVSSDAVILATK
jgi:hypothetical protein